MSYTAEMVKEEIAPDRIDMLMSLRKDEEVPPFLKAPGSPFIGVWLAGCWLVAKLREAGCPEERNTKIGFEHGQRSFHGDPYELAAGMFNAFQDDTLQERPGRELGIELIEKHTEVRLDDGRKTVVFKVGDAKTAERLKTEIADLQEQGPDAIAERIAELEREMAEIEQEL